MGRRAARGERGPLTRSVPKERSVLQMAHPDWTDNADVDGKLAFETRKNFLETHADGPVLILGTHFASPTAGHIVRDGDSFRFAI